MVKLSKRLAAIASHAADGRRIADVGTDHGHIPVWLAQRGGAERITASDIRPGPLASARAFAAEHDAADKIAFVLADGLRGLGKDFDTVILAGMGGETIRNILAAAPWTKNGVKLILQPQSKTGELANWLDGSGYAIEDAQLVRDAGKLYLILVVRGGASRAPFSCAEIYADRLLMEKRDPLLPDYLDELIARFTKRLRGLEREDDPPVDEYDHVRLALAGFQRMKEETETW